MSHNKPTGQYWRQQSMHHNKSGESLSKDRILKVLSGSFALWKRLHFNACATLIAFFSPRHHVWAKFLWVSLDFSPGRLQS